MSVFDSVIAFFASSSDPEAEKKRRLRQISKDIAHCKFNFYNPHSHIVTPSCAKFFFEVYKTVAPAQQLLQNTGNSKVIREIIIEQFLTPHQKEVLTRLTEESINERGQSNPGALAEQVKNDLQTMSNEFSSESAQNIDKTYSLLIALTDFSSFDYFFTLKKFNSGLLERSFSTVPAFDSIRADYILDDLREFASLAYGLPLDDNWSGVFSAVKKIKGIDPVNPQQWNKMIKLLKEVRKSGLLEMMIRHIAQKPDESITPAVVSMHIVDEYIQKKRTMAELQVQKIQSEKRNGKIEALAAQIFGTANVVRLKNYSEKANTLFTKKMLGGFTHVEALNYTKAFLVDYYKRDVRELVNLFLIKGKWTSAVVSSPLSESFYAIMDLSDKLTEFDDSLGAEGAIGQKMKNMLNKVDRDKEQLNFLRNLLKDTNDKANIFVMTAARHCIITGKILKQLIEDAGAQKKELIVNWPEINKAAEKEVRPVMVEVYKKIYNFVTLIQYFSK